MYYVYLIKSKTNKLYIGSTNNLCKRLKEHQNGRVFSTKNLDNIQLIYCESFKSEKDARLREKQLKYHGKAYQELKKRLKNSLKGAG